MTGRQHTLRCGYLLSGIWRPALRQTGLSGQRPISTARRLYRLGALWATAFGGCTGITQRHSLWPVGVGDV